MPDLFGADADGRARPQRGERLFFAVMPDGATADRVDGLGRCFLDEYQPFGRRLRKDRLHVSLHHLGDYRRLRSPLTYAAQKAANEVSMRAFEATLRGVTSFQAAPVHAGRNARFPHVLLVEGDGLYELHARLAAAMTKLGLKAWPNFTPHMTLSYGPVPIAARLIEPIHFTVTGFCLIHSRLGLTEYEMMGRWPLLP